MNGLAGTDLPSIVKISNIGEGTVHHSRSLLKLSNGVFILAVQDIQMKLGTVAPPRGQDSKKRLLANRKLHTSKMHM